MIANERLVSFRASDVFVPESERLVANFSGNSNARELVRLIGIGIGVPVDALHEIHNIGSNGIACLMYMYEEEYCGSRTHPGVWGEAYTRTLLGRPSDTGTRGSVNRQSLWFRNEVELTDMVCSAYVSGLGRGCWWILDKMLIKYKDRIDPVRFSLFVQHIIDQRVINSSHLGELLLRIPDGIMLKSIMDKLNESKNSSRTRDALVGLRESSTFGMICAHVTARIAESLNPTTEAAAEA